MDFQLVDIPYQEPVKRKRKKTCRPNQDRLANMKFEHEDPLSLMDDKDAMRLFSFSPEFHGLVNRLHFLDVSNLKPEAVHGLYQICGMNYYYEINVMPPKEFQRVILWAMLSADLTNEDMLAYVGARI